MTTKPSTNHIHTMKLGIDSTLSITRRILFCACASAAGCFCFGADEKKKEPYVYASFSSKEFRSKKGRLELKKLEGTHSIGIVCEEAVFRKLFDHRKEMKVSIEEPIPKGAELIRRSFGGPRTLCDQIKNCRYIFGVAYRGDLNLLLELPAAIQNDEFRIVLVVSPR